MKKISTIIDVAELANVSVATVSRVLNGSDKVKADTVKRVNIAIEKLQYEPNIAARNLRRFETGTILVILPDIANPFYSQIMSGISDAARKGNYNAFICQTRRDSELEEKFLNMLIHKRADGAIVLTTPANKEKLIRLADRVPIVQCAEFIPDASITHVSVDNYGAAAAAMQYIASLGHKRIALVSSTNEEYGTHERTRAYMEAVKKYKLYHSFDYIQSADADYSYQSGFNAALRLLQLENIPTAIFCISDVLAIGAMNAAISLGIHVPDQLSVFGFDDIELASMYKPSISTIRQPRYDIGYRATKELLKLVNHKTKKKRGHQIFLDYEIVYRESTKSLQN